MTLQKIPGSDVYMMSGISNLREQQKNVNEMSQGPFSE